MQQYKEQFKDKTLTGKTIGNIQSCLRLNDLEEIGDGSHFLYFNMIGLFSFRDWTVEKSIDFFFVFLQKLNLKPDYVTIHPDKISEWQHYYDKHHVEIRSDEECIWSDGGELGGYCTEFYLNGLEIGNIVNTSGDSIDTGFGLERLNSIVNNVDIESDTQTLTTTIQKCIGCGIRPSNKEQGYVLRKLLRELRKRGGSIEHEYFQQEVSRYQKSLERYNRLKDKFKDNDPDWWFDTHGIDVNDLK
jgi:alanyl-tRNA synthetase